MDSNKFSDIGHHDHVIASPVSSAKIDEIIAVLRCRPDESVLDIGCGKGEMLIRLAEHYRVTCSGIDISAMRVKEARQLAATRGVEALVRFDVKDGKTVGAEKYNVVICMGAGSAFGGTRGMITRLKNSLHSGGRLVIDSGYWKCSPDPDYLEFLGTTADFYGGYAEPIRLGIEAGLEFIYGRAANQDEWDHFEGIYLQAIIRYLQKNPGDPDSKAIRQRIYSWRDGYYKWGRATLGYGIYVFLMP